MYILGNTVQSRVAFAKQHTPGLIYKTAKCQGSDVVYPFYRCFWLSNNVLSFFIIIYSNTNSYLTFAFYNRTSTKLKTDCYLNKVNLHYISDFQHSTKMSILFHFYNLLYRTCTQSFEYMSDTIAALENIAYTLYKQHSPVRFPSTLKQFLTPNI